MPYKHWTYWIETQTFICEKNVMPVRLGIRSCYKTHCRVMKEVYYFALLKYTLSSIDRGSGQLECHDLFDDQ